MRINTVLMNDERNLQTQVGFTLNKTIGSNSEKTLDQLANDIYGSALFKLYFAYLVIQSLVIICYLCYKWQYKLWWEIKFYIPQIRKYLGCLLGILSTIISFVTLKNMNISEVRIPSVIHVILFSISLSAAAVLLAYGFKGRPNPLVGYFVIVLSVAICLEARISLVDPEPKQRFLAQTTFGVFHSFIGALLILMSYREEISEIPWLLVNGGPHFRTQLRI